MSWWPWDREDREASEAPPDSAEPVELTPAGMNVLWQARVDQAHSLIGDALRKYGNRGVPADVLLDIQIALHPPKPLRPTVPYVPGRDGARRTDA